MPTPPAPTVLNGPRTLRIQYECHAYLARSCMRQAARRAKAGTKPNMMRTVKIRSNADVAQNPALLHLSIPSAECLDNRLFD